MHSHHRPTPPLVERGGGGGLLQRHTTDTLAPNTPPVAIVSHALSQSGSFRRLSRDACTGMRGRSGT